MANFQNYEVRISQKATKPRIDIDIHGMKLVIPEGLNIKPEELIEQKRDWIEKKQREFEKLRQRIPERTFEEGEKFPFQGENYEIIVNEVDSSQIKKDSFVLSEKQVQKRGIKAELEKLYRKQARQFIESKVAQYTTKLGVDYDTLRIKNQKTLWGSCSSKNNLNFNWRLIMAPPDKAEYVVIHELCHLQEPNHSKKFWRLLSKHCENPKQKAQWLRDHSVELIFTEDDL